MKNTRRHRITLDVSITDKFTAEHIAKLVTQRAWNVDGVEGAELVAVVEVQRVSLVQSAPAKPTLRYEVSLLALRVKDALGAGRAREIIHKYAPKLNSVKPEDMPAFKADLEAALLMHRVAREADLQAAMQNCFGEPEGDQLASLEVGD